ncbi:hypothetical protein QO003_003625 [Arthrobacter silviterrae]|uniref:DUF222 domain-containing protein n=1 Tax=Arthrobacter silviterrae TaxID=2026658 RepID=A0ABX0D9Z8_9MICC|nr:HNH endonuclease signature motif containing protein [Arthrobacter silviterrae]MDQ0279322.1 hypothetical protein [Arthrobacter silviterrae]NGN83476.1 DUF222 domain-containing protein [Arthrobacter silviterrae]
MEAATRTPGNPGSTRTGGGVGGHVRQLIALAEALTRAATANAGSGGFDATDGTRVAGESGPSSRADQDAGPDARNAGPVAPLGMDVDSLSDAEAVSWAQELEHLGSFLSALQVQVAGNLAGRVRAGRFDGVKAPMNLLSTSLRVSRGEAGRRLRLADQFLPVRNDLTLVTTPPAQATTAAAFFAGELSAEQALTASRFIEEARHLADGGRITADEALAVEATLTDHARTMDPESLTHVGVRIVNVLDPDGHQPTEGELIAKEGVVFRQARRGLIHFEGWTTVPKYEVMMVAIDSTMNPRPHTDVNDIEATNGAAGGLGADKRAKAGLGTGGNGGVLDGVLPGQTSLGELLDLAESATPTTLAQQDGSGSAGNPDGPVSEEPWPHVIDGVRVPGPGSGEELPCLNPIDPANTNPVVADRRTRAQRLLDGMIDCIRLAARTSKLPANGGLKPQLFITTTEEDLQRKTKDGRPGGIAFLPYSGPQPLGLFSTELCDADVTTLLLGNGQEILNVGRTQRFFTKAQRKILIARDKGCSFPHCTRPAYWCDAHHVNPWVDGGETNVDVGCLLCVEHHHAVHQGHWSVEMILGTPWYTPSYKLDPTRTKLRNNYHHGLPDTRSQTS